MIRYVGKKNSQKLIGFELYLKKLQTKNILLKTKETLKLFLNCSFYTID